MDKNLYSNKQDDDNAIKELRFSVHYYGDAVRKLFFFGGFVVLLTFPFLNDIFPVHNIFFSVFALLLVLLAALTNPKLKVVMSLNVAAAFIAVVAFEFYAKKFYVGDGGSMRDTFLFTLSHILAINFLFAFYFSVKTLRSMIIK